MCELSEAMQTVRNILFGDDSIRHSSQHIKTGNPPDSDDTDGFVDQNCPEFQTAVWITEQEESLNQRMKGWETLMMVAGSVLMKLSLSIMKIDRNSIRRHLANSISSFGGRIYTRSLQTEARCSLFQTAWHRQSPALRCMQYLIAS